jgi:hypothetical protein
VRRLLERTEFQLTASGSNQEFQIFEHPDGRVVPVNPKWTGIEVGDPVFNCLQRDLQLSVRTLRRRLNEAQKGD